MDEKQKRSRKSRVTVVLFLVGDAAMLASLFTLVLCLSPSGYNYGDYLIQNPECQTITKENVVEMERLVRGSAIHTLMDLDNGESWLVYATVNPLYVDGIYVVNAKEVQFFPREAIGPFDKCPPLE